ncbi:hypothetical protein [Streptomyces siamensis]|uniref:Uncharacterized protein n=1 Tax=Streptomyces siamensis TaxID=1274986 RepID=A0ABP9ID38_9ACTN
MTDPYDVDPRYQQFGEQGRAGVPDQTDRDAADADAGHRTAEAQGHRAACSPPRP